MNHFHKICCFHKTEYKSDVHSIPQSHISVFVLPIYLLSQMIRIQNYKFKFRADKSVFFNQFSNYLYKTQKNALFIFWPNSSTANYNNVSHLFSYENCSRQVFPRYSHRAADRSRKKKSNFAGFLGTNSQENRPISREFSGQTSPKSNR